MKALPVQLCFVVLGFFGHNSQCFVNGSAIDVVPQSTSSASFSYLHSGS